MKGFAVPRSSYEGSWLKRAVAVLVTLGLAIAIVRLGLKPLPVDVSPLKLQWDLTNFAPLSLGSPNGDVEQIQEGLVLSPKEGPAWLTTGWISHSMKGLGRARVRLKVQQSAEGRIALFRHSKDSPPLVFPFRSHGGGFEDIVVPLAIGGASDDLLDEVRLIPSVIPQTVVVASVVLESEAPFVMRVGKELTSPLPGELMAIRGTSINWLPPFVIDGRSAWLVLMPLVLLSATVLCLTKGHTRVVMIARQCAWTAFGAVWGLAFSLMVYHQAVAVALDTQNYGGLNRDDAYAVMDTLPLEQDMREAAQHLASHTVTRFILVGDQSPETMRTRWKERAGYYLLPIQISPSAPTEIVYFAGARPLCAEISSQKVVLYEAARFCLFRTQE